MKSTQRILPLSILSSCAIIAGLAVVGLKSAHAAAYTPLNKMPTPRLVNHSENYPGGSFNASNLLDGKPKTEYSSNGKGTNTFVELEFTAESRVGAFRHLDRNDPATISTSSLEFFDADGRTSGSVVVSNASTRGGETFLVFPEPIKARKVKWQVTGLGPNNHGTVGGAEMEFFAVGPAEPTLSKDTLETKALPFLKRADREMMQPIKFTLNHPYAESVNARLRIAGMEPKPVVLKPGIQTLMLDLPSVGEATVSPLTVEVDEKPVLSTVIRREPVKRMMIYILPHSHTDIGYTEIQTDIEKKQVENLVQGIEYANKTGFYPLGARFIWNVEVSWAADLYLRRLNEKQKADFDQAVRRGQVVLNGMYLNELTGLCRPEELLRLFRHATKLSDQYGVTVDSAMISDVPGYTWGTVSAMAHAGIKYFSTAPNYFDRIGTILREWENRPFYWVGPDGKEKVLVWIPFWGYAMSHVYHKMTPRLVEDFFEGLARKNYPYDIAHVRWSGLGDNAVPDPSICDFVKDWNSQYAWPKFIISGTGAAFRALEDRYGKDLPVVRGDWTPYWEDGAGSSSLETALNRQTSDRLTQAETLFAMRDPKSYPSAAFEDAMNSVLLYSEHTWGAWCSISGPERKETREQWEIKKGYALEAEKRTGMLFEKALRGDDAVVFGSGEIEVINTASWPRTELIVLNAEQSVSGNLVMDRAGNEALSQRLSDGRLAFLARNVPPFGTKRFTVQSGIPRIAGDALVDGSFLANKVLRVRVDEKTGGISELRIKGIQSNFADTRDSAALNDYLYLIGDDVSTVKKNGPVSIRVGEKGPLVASLLVESDAPGCKKLTREIRIIAGMDHVEIVNLLDKSRMLAKDYYAKEAKESVNFGFAFNVADGEMRLDLPIGVIRPEVDQMPSACKNWFTVGRWADVSNKERGITWVTLDAPLVQVGGITANLLNSQTNPDAWRNKVDRTQKLYSWAMNNHWGTNYRAYQDGLTRFRFILRPHRAFDSAEASRFSTGFSQPLVVNVVSKTKPAYSSLLSVEPSDVVVSALKPSDDGKALILRLYGASGKDKTASVTWNRVKPSLVCLSDTSEKPAGLAGARINVPAYGVVTLRAELD